MLRSSSVRLGRRGILWLRGCVCGVWFWGGTMFRLARSGLPKRFLLLLVCSGMSFFGPLLLLPTASEGYGRFEGFEAFNLTLLLTCSNRSRIAFKVHHRPILCRRRSFLFDGL